MTETGSSFTGVGILTIFIVAVVFLGIFVIIKYNKIIKLKNYIKKAFADVDVQMKLRFDLVDNLINTVKGYTEYEKGTLQELTNSRTDFLNAKNDNEKLAANDQLTGTLKTLFAVAENYPDLKANTNFQQLQTELSDIENKLAAARRFLNSCVNEYNTSIETFPSNLIAKAFGFTQYDFFAANEEEKQTPKVKF